MAEQQTKQEWHAVYTADGEGEPVALFRNGAHAQQFRRTVLGRDSVVAETDSLKANADVKALFESRRPTAAGTDAVQAAEDVRKAEIRSRILREEEEKEIEREVRAELAAERKGEPAGAAERPKAGGGA